LPADHDGSWPLLLERSRLFFEDLPEVHRRRETGEHRQVVDEVTRGKRPGYYLQNFHFQSGGWMTRESAQRYDTQVEVLFKGTANATRRQALPPLQRHSRDAISAASDYSTSAVAPDVFLTQSSRHGRACQPSASISRKLMSRRPDIICGGGAGSTSRSPTRKLFR
jgi:hypothetical protein